MEKKLKPLSLLWKREDDIIDVEEAIALERGETYKAIAALPVEEEEGKSKRVIFEVKNLKDENIEGGEKVLKALGMSVVKIMRKAP